MSDFQAPCAYCGDPIDPYSRFTWRLVVGWERKATAASRKGGSDIALRQSRDKYACDRCVSRLQQKLAPTQESLL